MRWNMLGSAHLARYTPQGLGLFRSGRVLPTWVNSEMQSPDALAFSRDTAFACQMSLFICHSKLKPVFWTEHRVQLLLTSRPAVP